MGFDTGEEVLEALGAMRDLELFQQAAVRQAIANAVGARMQQTPMTPQAVLQELLGDDLG